MSVCTALTALDTTAEAEGTGAGCLGGLLSPQAPSHKICSIFSPISLTLDSRLQHSRVLDKVISSEFIPKYHLKSSSINQNQKTIFFTITSENKNQKVLVIKLKVQIKFIHTSKELNFYSGEAVLYFISIRSWTLGKIEMRRRFRDFSG